MQVGQGADGVLCTQALGCLQDSNILNWMSWFFVISTISWCWCCQDLAKIRATHSIRMRDKPSGLPLHSLDQLYPRSQEQQLPGSSTFPCWAPALGLHLGPASSQGWPGRADTLPAWASVPIRIYFQGTTGKSGCHLEHMPCLCCWLFQIVTRLWKRIFGLPHTKCFMYISQDMVIFVGVYDICLEKNARGL